MLHKLLRRQLKRFKIPDSLVEEHIGLFERVSDAYSQNEREVHILERSLYHTSNELTERNTLLKSQLGELTETKNQLLQSFSVLNATFDATGEKIFVYDIKGNLVTVNSMAREFFNLFDMAAFTHWSEFMTLMKSPALAQQIADELREDPKQHMTGHFQLINDRFYEYRSLPQLKEGELLGRVWCFRDVTVEKQSEKTIHYQAYHDALTGLPNRLLLLDRIDHALTIARRDKLQLAILFIDLDNFKRVNDTEGHKGGDDLLIQVVNRIQSRLREQDTLARLGGDEFVILLESVKDRERLTSLCEELLTLLNSPFSVNTRQHFVSSSIGVAIYPQDGATSEELIRKADMAMYAAKNDGKDTYQFYQPSLEVHALRQMQIERELRIAIDKQQLEVYFQPKLGLSSLQIVGAEVLMRWFNDDGKPVSPELFIPVAESTGLIKKIGEFAIDSAISQIQTWNEMGLKNIKLAVNLSIIEFQDKDLIQHIIDAVQNANMTGDQLILELTESIFMENKDQISRTMKQLKALGIAFALDDFGKGYSSFSYLQTLPIDYLKVDKSFLQDVTTNEQSAAITRCIIDIGHNLNLKIVAEGIESQETLDYVSEANCAVAQGFYLYKPMPSDAFTQLLLQLND